MISQKDFYREVAPMFDRADTYEKFKKIVARKAVPGEVIITVTSDGKETQNTAIEGDYVVQNQTEAKEQYIVSAESFNKKYVLFLEVDSGMNTYNPIGKIQAIELTSEKLDYLSLPDEFKFIAAWGEGMVAKKGDFLCRPIDGNEVYRIARKEFFETYKKQES